MRPNPYPIFRTPRIFCDAVMDIHHRTGIDPAAIATAMLASFSLAASTLVRIEVESGFVIPPGLFVQIIAESGFGKSILDTCAQEPFKAYARQSAARKAKNQRQYEGERVIWEEKKKSQLSMFRKKIKLGECVTQLEQDIKQHEENKPLEQEADRLLLSDSTPSSINNFYAGTGKVGGMFISEGSVVFKDGRMFSELGLLCNLFDGTSFSVDRAIGGSISIIEPAAASLVFSQNQIHHKYYLKHGEELLSSGLYPRTLFYFAEHNNVVVDFVPYEHDKRCSEEFHNLMRAMLDEHAKLIGSKDNNKRLLKLSPEATQLYQVIKKQFKCDTQPMRPLENFKGFAAKFTNNLIRISCLFHLMEGREGDIKKDSVEQAYGICLWYLQQAMMYFDENRIFETKAYQLYYWIIGQLNTREVSYLEVTTLYQYAPNRFRGKHNIAPLLLYLTEKKMLMTEKIKGVGNVVKIFSFGF